MLTTGTVLNNSYRVVKLLGKGAMGNVYLVERIKDDKEFVIKELIFGEVSGIDERAGREIFRREADFMKKFDHSGLPKTYGTFKEKNKDYLIMDYIEGETLEEIIFRGPVTEETAIKWITELCNIMDYLHNYFHNPIVYRDLKPSNIIISGEEATLVDFGIARYYNPDKNTDTFSYGSPGYAAPEQYRGKGQSSPQSDIFGLGVILFQMLTGYDPTIKPFTFPEIKSLNPNISAELENIIKRAIELNPGKRYISMDEFRERLEKYSGTHSGQKKLRPLPPLPPPPPKERNKIALISILTTAITFGLIIILMIPYDMLNHEKRIPAIKIIMFINFVGLLLGFALAIAGVIAACNNSKLSSGLQAIGFNIFIISINICCIGPSISMPCKAGACLACCESNLKNIATALEMYATDYKGDYPSSLEQLIDKHYIKAIPACPHTFAPYKYTFNREPDNFTIWCGKPKAHINTGTVSKEGCWPQYSPGEGIKRR